MDDDPGSRSVRGRLGATPDSPSPFSPSDGGQRRSKWQSDRGSEHVSTMFERTVEEGHRRLSRSWPGLLATGTVGGIDVSVGLFALLIVEHETHNTLLAALAFGIGFMALTLANSELFTENFLVPIAAVVSGKSRRGALLRLWGGTAAMNLVGGYLMCALIIGGAPHLKPTAVEAATFYAELGLGWRSFSLALLGGTAITLMTWMERGTDSVTGKLAAALATAFLLAAAPLNHAIVVSLHMFAALQAGAPFGYLDWLGVLGWAALGNAVGGIGLVTMLRLVQVGRGKLEEERRRPLPDEEAEPGGATE